MEDFKGQIEVVYVFVRDIKWHFLWVQRFRVQRFRVQRFRVQRFRVQRFRVQGSKVQGSGFKGSGFRVQRFRVSGYVVRVACFGNPFLLVVVLVLEIERSITVSRTRTIQVS
jgi:hypothetical protein